MTNCSAHIQVPSVQTSYLENVSAAVQVTNKVLIQGQNFTSSNPNCTITSFILKKDGVEWPGTQCIMKNGVGVIQDIVYIGELCSLTRFTVEI